MQRTFSRRCRVGDRRAARGRRDQLAGLAIDQQQSDCEAALPQPEPKRTSSDLTILVPVSGRFEVHDTRHNDRLAVFLTEPLPEADVLEWL